MTSLILCAPLDSFSAKIGTLFPSLFYFCDLYLGAERYARLQKSMKAREAFKQVFPSVDYAESTWSKVRRQFRRATEEECSEWVAKGHDSTALYQCFQQLVKDREYIRSTLPWEDSSRRRGQMLKPLTPGAALAVLDDIDGPSHLSVLTGMYIFN